MALPAYFGKGMLSPMKWTLPACLFLLPMGLFAGPFDLFAPLPLLDAPAKTAPAKIQLPLLPPVREHRVYYSNMPILVPGGKKHYSARYWNPPANSAAIRTRDVQLITPNIIVRPDE